MPFGTSTWGVGHGKGKQVGGCWADDWSVQNHVLPVALGWWILCLAIFSKDAIIPWLHTFSSCLFLASVTACPVDNSSGNGHPFWGFTYSFRKQKHGRLGGHCATESSTGKTQSPIMRSPKHGPRWAPDFLRTQRKPLGPRPKMDQGKPNRLNKRKDAGLSPSPISRLVALQVGILLPKAAQEELGLPKQQLQQRSGFYTRVS